MKSDDRKAKEVMLRFEEGYEAAMETLKRINYSRVDSNLNLKPLRLVERLGSAPSDDKNCRPMIMANDGCYWTVEEDLDAG